MNTNNKAHEYSDANLSVFLSRSLGLPSEQTHNIRVAAQYHDCGKIFVRKEILNKKDKLTEREFSKIKIHTVLGYKMLKELNYSKVDLDVVLYHHEKWDGTGYPKGLLGNDIPLEAQIVSICDYYDHLRIGKVYRGNMKHKQAFTVLLAEFGKKFNPKLKPFVQKCETQFLAYYLPIIDKGI